MYNKRYAYGIYAEIFVLILLFFKFYKILHRRYKTKYGEIDIIAKRGNKIIFVEVKGRRNLDYFELVSKNKINRIKKSAIYFLLSCEGKYSSYTIQFDLVYVVGYLKFKYISNAFCD